MRLEHVSADLEVKSSNVPHILDVALEDSICFMKQVFLYITFVHSTHRVTHEQRSSAATLKL